MLGVSTYFTGLILFCPLSKQPFLLLQCSFFRLASYFNPFSFSVLYSFGLSTAFKWLLQNYSRWPKNLCHVEAQNPFPKDYILLTLNESTYEWVKTSSANGEDLPPNHHLPGLHTSDRIELAAFRDFSQSCKPFAGV